MMRRLRFALATLVLLAPGFTLAAPARSDDWLQFRKDPWRRAASSDAVRLPLTEIWRHGVPDPGISAPHTSGPFDTIIWKERVFFITKGRLLTCADARTGRTIWQQTLLGAVGRSPKPDTGLAISDGGLLFIYDDLAPAVGQRAASARPVGIFGARVLNAADGKPVSMYPLARRWHRGRNRPPSLPQEVDWPGPDGHVRLVLSGGVPGQTAFLDNRSARLHQVIGASPPLLLGNSLWAVTQDDMLFRWALGSDASYLSVARGPAGPLNELTLADAKFRCLSPAATPTGAVVAAGGGVRFLASIGSGTEALWYRDVPWNLGIPTVQDDLIFTGVGGGSASAGVMATDVATGATRWIYPSPRIAPDPPDSPTFHKQRGGPDPTEVMIGRPSGVAFASDGGLVVVGKRVYASVAGAIVALDQATGREFWRQPLPPSTPVRSMVASREHLFISMGTIKEGALVALRLEDGRPMWSQPVPRPGGLSLAHGLVFHADGAVLTVYGPAERTFRVAVDSPKAEDYEEPPRKKDEEGGQEESGAKAADEEADPQRAAEPDKAPAAPGAPETKEPAVPLLKAPPVADASILRLRWSDPLDDLVRKVRERRAVAKGLPLTLVLDWLNADRSALAGPAGWSLAQTEAFAAACGRLAAEGRPDFFEVGSEVNPYLVRYPDQIESVRSLLKAARQAVAAVSPQTVVLVSLNLEVWSGRYSRGIYSPFGKLPARKPATLAQIQSLVEGATAVAFTSWPEAAYLHALDVPQDHFQAARAAFPEQQLLWTRLAVRYNKQVPAEQALYLHRLLQGCYWLKVSVIAYPELQAEGPLGPDRDYALRDVRGVRRLAHTVWQDTRALKWVKRLTLEGPSQELDPEPEAEPAPQR